MAHKVQIEITGPVQDPVSGEVIYQPGTRFDEGAKELAGIPAHMLRPVFSDVEEKPKGEDAPKLPHQTAPAAAKK